MRLSQIEARMEERKEDLERKIAELKMLIKTHQLDCYEEEDAYMCINDYEEELEYLVDALN